MRSAQGTIEAPCARERDCGSQTCRTPFSPGLRRGGGWGYACRMLDWTTCPAVERVPGRVSGAWVFKDTRLPVRTLFENLEAGASVDEFLQWYEGVTRQQVLDVLRHAERSLAVPA